MTTIMTTMKKFFTFLAVFVLFLQTLLPNFLYVQAAEADRTANLPAELTGLIADYQPEIDAILDTVKDGLTARGADFLDDFADSIGGELVLEALQQIVADAIQEFSDIYINKDALQQEIEKAVRDIAEKVVSGAIGAEEAKAEVAKTVNGVVQQIENEIYNAVIGKLTSEEVLNQAYQVGYDTVDNPNAYQEAYDASYDTNTYQNTYDSVYPTLLSEVTDKETALTDAQAAYDTATQTLATLTSGLPALEQAVQDAQKAKEDIVAYYEGLIADAQLAYDNNVSNRDADIQKLKDEAKNVYDNAISECNKLPYRKEFCEKAATTVYNAATNNASSVVDATISSLKNILDVAKNYDI